GVGLFRILKGNTATQIGSSGDYGDFYNVNFAIDFQVGIDDEPEAADIFVYPNPTTGLIRINTSFDNSDVMTTVFDATGKIVMIKNLFVSEYTTEMDLSSLHSGLYMIRMEANGKKVNRRVVIMN
nr:T9SS type A sorting domain-containing protein [Bacteroidia bacterium]